MNRNKLTNDFDPRAEKIEALKQLIPEAIQDGKINVEALKDFLQEEVQSYAEDDEAFAFTWPGKKKARQLAFSKTEKTLEPVAGEGLDEDNTRNLFIEGDNLEVLKALKKSYQGKVKMIYIDPPYNTGNDFVYKDNFSESEEVYLKRQGLIDDEGNKLVKNTKNSGRFHSAWLNMMYPRLILARDFLRDDGVIFISIDDNEQSNLKKLCDEIFGEENFIANLIWQKKFSRANDASYFSTMHDHILCYAKRTKLNNNGNSWKLKLLPRGDEMPDGYTNPDDDHRGHWTSVVLSAKSGTEKLIYEITTPSGRKCLPPDGRFWGVNRDRFSELDEDNRVWFGKDGSGIPRLKTFLSEVQDGLRPNTIWFHQEVGHNQEGRQEVKKLFDDKGYFDGPKPVRLLDRIIQISNLSSSDIVLDFFAGSATTGHAVVNHNACNETSLKYILVQLPEICDERSEAFKAGFTNIADISKERIRRASKKIAEENPEFAKTGDLGFKVFKITDTNLKKEEKIAEVTTQSELFDSLESNSESRLKDGWTVERLLCEVMLIEGMPLDSKVTSLKFGTNSVFSVVSDMVPQALKVCFDETLSKDLIDEIKLSDHDRFICLDSAIDDANYLRLSDKGLIKTI